MIRMQQMHETGGGKAGRREGEKQEGWSRVSLSPFRRQLCPPPASRLPHLDSSRASVRDQNL